MRPSGPMRDVRNLEGALRPTADVSASRSYLKRMKRTTTAWINPWKYASVIMCSYGREIINYIISAHF